MRFAVPFVSLVAALVACFPAAAQAGSTVDYSLRTSTVDGKPFYPLGIYAVGPEDFARVRDYGFNLVQNYGFGGWSDQRVKDYLDAAYRNGLRVFFNLPAAKNGPVTSAENVALLKRRVAMFKDHPAVFSWYLADEPSVKKESPQEMAELYRWIKATDPHHPVMTSNWELEHYVDSTDMDMRQIYGGPPERIAPAEKGYWAEVGKSGKDWVAILNTYDSRWGEKRKLPAVGLAAAEQDAKRKKDIVEVADLPPEDEMSLNPASFRNVRPGSPAEAALMGRERRIAENLANPPYPTSFAFPDSAIKFRGAALDVIAHGSNGIFYWLWQPEDKLVPKWGWYTMFVRPALRPVVRDTMHELVDVAERISAPSVGSHTFRAGPDGAVFVWCRKQGQHYTVIAVNESGKPQDVKISLPWKQAPAAMTANREGRRIPLADGKLGDSFAPNEAHLYIE